MNITLICQLVLLFFLFSCVGWVMEVILKYIQFHRFINRGFLIGPYCPIYGFGAVAVTVLVGGLVGREGTVSEIFWAGYVICGALEYFTSWYMENRFHARWWDYSSKPMNLHGRIWVGNLLLFGAASVLIVCLIDPIYFRLAEKIPAFWLYFGAIAVAVLLLADCITSHVLMNVVRREIDTQEGDNTEEITVRVRELLRNRSLLYHRIEQAYPDLHTRPHWLTLKVRQAKKEYKLAHRQVSQFLREIRVRRGKADSLTSRLDAALEREKNTLQNLRALQKKQLRRKDWEE